jgi:hypothetical protein
LKFLGHGSETSINRFTSHSKTIGAETAYWSSGYATPIYIPPGIRALCSKVKIDAASVAVNTPIVREQLQELGVRLAHLLDAALGK